MHIAPMRVMMVHANAGCKRSQIGDESSGGWCLRRSESSGNEMPEMHGAMDQAAAVMAAVAATMMMAVAVSTTAAAGS